MTSTSSKENTEEIFKDIKTNLTRGAKDRKHNFHTPVFSNVNDEGEVNDDLWLRIYNMSLKSSEKLLLLGGDEVNDKLINPA